MAEQSFFSFRETHAKKFSSQNHSQSATRKRIRYRLAQHRSAFGDASKILQNHLAEAWGEIDSSMSGKLPVELKDKMHRAYAAAIGQADAWVEIARLLEQEFGLTDRY